ncbi:MAG: ferric reductase-like transmembrane domain-containing protein [Candidatus Kerfeldbacteria bacterium]|nr:ferric reductase-like transmembrane domain-containing protein [Candidatus Kerfeldbacteria bacterium]
MKTTNSTITPQPQSKSAATPPSRQPSGYWKFQFQQYGVAVALATLLFAVLSVYLIFRRGYYDFYIANKVFAGVAAVCIGVILLIGPLSRFSRALGRYIQYRKELGIVAFLLALIHGVVSLFFLPSKFPLSGFFGTLRWPFLFGLSATIVLVAAFVISNDRAMAAIGGKRWWWLQNWGVRFAFLLTLLHVFVMKWNGWVQWYTVGGGRDLIHPEWPGAGLLVGWFMAFVVLVRLAEFGGPRLGRAVWYVSIVALPAIYIATFWWGRQFMR